MPLLRISDLSRVLVCLGLLTALLGAQRPYTNFFVLPDDVLGPGSGSMITGLVQGAPVALDLTARQSDMLVGHASLALDPANPASYVVQDVELHGRDENTGHTIQLELAPGGGGSWTTSYAGGYFTAGAVMSISVPVLISGTQPGLPSSGTFSASGTVVPGYFHVITPLVGTIDTMPGVGVTLVLKEDAFVPDIVWHYACDGATSFLNLPGSGAEALFGRVAIQRDPQDLRRYTVGPVLLESLGGTSMIAAAGSGGQLFLDPTTRKVSGLLSLIIDGIPRAVPLNGNDDGFAGAATQPTSIAIEQGIQGVGQIQMDLRRIQLVTNGSVPTIGAVYTPLLRGPPGFGFIVGASFDPAPGLNTPVGDVPVDIDDLLILSLTPNPWFLGMQGVMPASGESPLQIFLLNDPGLAGFSFFLGGALFHPAGDLVGVTQPHRVTL